MTIRDDVERIVHAVREQQGGREALGNCIENAEALKAAFDEEYPEWNARISYGAIDYDNGCPAPESYWQAKQEGEIHHWVVLDTDDGEYHCDVASESAMCWPPGSEPMIRRGAPPHDYIDFGHRRSS